MTVVGAGAGAVAALARPVRARPAAREPQFLCYVAPFTLLSPAFRRACIARSE